MFKPPKYPNYYWEEQCSKYVLNQLTVWNTQVRHIIGRPVMGNLSAYSLTLFLTRWWCWIFSIILLSCSIKINFFIVFIPQLKFIFINLLFQSFDEVLMLEFFNWTHVFLFLYFFIIFVSKSLILKKLKALN